MEKERIFDLTSGIPKEYREKFEDERLDTNVRRMFGFAIYTVSLQITLNVLNAIYPQVLYVETKVQVPLKFYVLLSLLTLFCGVTYCVLFGLAKKGAIKSRSAKWFLVNSGLYLYILVQMTFCTFGILGHQGINGQTILVVLIGSIPILEPRQSVITIGATALYVFVLLLATQWNTDADGQTQFMKIFMSDMRAWFFIINLMMMMIAVFVYRLYASNFVLLNKFRELSETDALTKLPNRRKFDEVINLEWRRALRQGSALTFIIFDIDCFKNYNDTYGHQKGDECLAMIGEILRKKFKRANEYVARYGGEEFALIMANYRKDDGVQVCQRLVESVSALGIPHAKSTAADIVTVSAGMIATVPREADSIEDFIKNADAALYEAKATGKNRYVVAETGEAAD